MLVGKSYFLLAGLQRDHEDGDRAFYDVLSVIIPLLIKVKISTPVTLFAKPQFRILNGYNP